MTIPNCISRAAAPVTKGAAMKVPFRTLYPPPGAVLNMLTAGAVRSGLASSILVKPLPEKDAKVSVALS